MDGDSYLLELVRYVHLNPVHCGLVCDPLEYPWSSHRVYLGKESLSWLTTDSVLGQLSKSRSEARQRYAVFVQDGLGEGYRKGLHQAHIDRRVLGDDRLFERVEHNVVMMTPHLLDLADSVACVCRNYGGEIAELKSASQQRHFTEAHTMIAWLARTFSGAPLTYVGKEINRTWVR